MNKNLPFDLQKIDPHQIKNSKKWFDDQVNLLASKKITPGKIMTGQGGFNLTKRLRPGRPVFFFYDPKYKDTLPYYDRFPLVIPYDTTKDGFIGLNLHYLDYKPRLMLFKEMVAIYGKNNLTETAKIRYSWDLIRGASKFKAAAPCIKQYLYSHVKSPFCEIVPDAWYTAVMLPVQRFVGASAHSVWAETSRKMNW